MLCQYYSCLKSSEYKIVGRMKYQAQKRAQGNDAAASSLFVACATGNLSKFYYNESWKAKEKTVVKVNTVFTYWFYGLAAVLLILSFVKDTSKTLLSDQDKKAIYENADKL